MEILSSRILVRPVDFERSEHFYRDTLGLAVSREFGAGDHRGVVFFIGGGYLEVSGTAPASTPSNVALWLQVRDLPATHQRLQDQGVAVVRGPQREPWGLDELWIEDPDGLRIALIEVPPEHPLRRDTR